MTDAPIDPVRAELANLASNYETHRNVGSYWYPDEALDLQVKAARRALEVYDEAVREHGRPDMKVNKLATCQACHSRT